LEVMDINIPDRVRPRKPDFDRFSAILSSGPAVNGLRLSREESEASRAANAAVKPRLAEAAAQRRAEGQRRGKAQVEAIRSKLKSYWGQSGATVEGARGAVQGDG
jgi:hypothetical protein